MNYTVIEKILNAIRSPAVSDLHYGPFQVWIAFDHPLPHPPYGLSRQVISRLGGWYYYDSEPVAMLAIFEEAENTVKDLLIGDEP